MRSHREHPEDGDAYTERLMERADMLRAERKDREWEAAVEASEHRRQPKSAGGQAMTIEPGTITAQSVKILRVKLAEAAQAAFGLQISIELSNVTPEQAAAQLTYILQPLQIEKP